jgi:hypothetical protein
MFFLKRNHHLVTLGWLSVIPVINFPTPMKPNNLVLILCCLTGVTFGQSFEGNSNPVEIKLQPVEQVIPPQDEMVVTLEAMGIRTLPRYHALIIGVSQYKNAGPKLVNLDQPTKDAARLSAILTEKYAFNKEHVTLLLDPTREDIINNFDRLISTVGEKDNLLIFYAGHGYYDKPTDFGYWLPSDAKVDSRAAWIANSTIKDYLGAIKSQHTLLITDACFGGSIFKTRSVDAMIRKVHDLYKDKSRKAMTSGNLTEVPDKSVFVNFLLKSLDNNSDPFIASSTLFSRIYEPITDNAATIPQFGVVQGAGDEGGDFIFFKKK